MRAKTSDMSTVSTVMPWRWSATSSMRTVLKGVVRAPIAPTTMPLMPRTTRQTRSNSSTTVLKRSRAGVDRVRCGRGELDLVLLEDVHDGDLAAEGVAAQCRRHLVHLVRVRLDHDRHAGFLRARPRRRSRRRSWAGRRSRRRTRRGAGAGSWRRPHPRAAFPPRRSGWRPRRASAPRGRDRASADETSSRAEAISDAGKKPRFPKNRAKRDFC